LRSNCRCPEPDPAWTAEDASQDVVDDAVDVTTVEHDLF
jgi:hypothetical protein